MKKRLVILATIALLAVGTTADSAFAYGMSVVSTYTCPVTHPNLSCNPFTSTCSCY